MASRSRPCSQFLFIGVILIQFNQSEPLRCCEIVSGVCGAACKQVSSLAMGSTEGSPPGLHLGSLSIHCPYTLTRFWSCFNETLLGIREGAAWEGRPCCPLAQTPDCHFSCLTSLEIEDLRSECRQSDEPALYQCLYRQLELTNCCGLSNRPDCVSTCHSLIKRLPTLLRLQSEQKSELNSVCGRESNLISCLTNITQTSDSPFPNPHKFLSCCSESRNENCRSICRQVLKTGSGNENSIMETLVGNGCGPPSLHDKMWQCWLRRTDPIGNSHSPSQIHRLGMDAPKLHCCSRARGETCRRLCLNTFNREWSDSWSDLDSICLSSSDQLPLRACVDALDEPCELGCEGLKFCSAFTNRPSELYRGCNPEADANAQAQFTKWISDGVISIPFLPNSYSFSLRNESACAERWKALACALQLKPCHPRDHLFRICRFDCLSLLHSCLSLDDFALEEQISSICSSLSPGLDQPCISLTKYVRRTHPRTMSKATAKEVSRPCSENPCSSTQMCQVNREVCLPRDACETYGCVQGCKLGEVSRVVVPVGTWIRLQVAQLGCVRICRCSANGIDSCSETNCYSPSPCWWGTNRIDHGSTFIVHCNLCSCRFGEITCTKQNCDSNEDRRNQILLPCNCPNGIHSPVCGTNGKTYISHCFAKCSGLTDGDVSIGPCSQINPCEGVYCGNRYRCIPISRICLHPFGRKCPQYKCVAVSSCDSKITYCDIRGVEQTSLCALDSGGSIFNYAGHCLRQACSTLSPICGMDGLTYESECGAEGKGIPMDYEGHCKFMGIPNEKYDYSSCLTITCRLLPPECGGGITPPGACCPTCGAVLRLTYSPNEVLRLAETTGADLTSLDEIKGKLSGLVQTAECRLGIYLGQGAELVVIIRPPWTHWTKIQLHVCTSEGERLATLINQRSPLVELDAKLNLLTGAYAYQVRNSANRSHPFGFLYFLFILFICNRSYNFLNLPKPSYL